MTLPVIHKRPGALRVRHKRTEALVSDELQPNCGRIWVESPRTHGMKALALGECGTTSIFYSRCLRHAKVITPILYGSYSAGSGALLPS